MTWPASTFTRRRPRWRPAREPAMPLDWRARLSLYLPLALAGVCLGAAEQAFFPGIFFLVGPLLGLLVLAFLVEGRWTLSAGAANLLGLVIAGAWAVWLYLRFFGDAE